MRAKMAIESRLLFIWFAIGALLLIVSESVYPQYGYISDSNIDPTIMRIDEEKYLGARLDDDYVLVDRYGKEFRLKDLAGKPLILVLSYYSCDGSCPTNNVRLRETLSKIDRINLGKDYRVLTASFDKNDDLNRLQMFTEMTGLQGMGDDGWRVAIMKNRGDIDRFTGSAGFKFFWSPPDRTFLHTNVLIFLSPEMRIVRYLYGSAFNSKDIELAITEAAFERGTKSKFIDLINMACYSYNFKNGKYTLNYPLFVGFGSFLLGLLLITTPIFIVRKRKEVRS